MNTGRDAEVKVTQPTKITLISLKKGLDALDKKLFDSENRIDTHVGRMNIQSHSAMLLMKRVEARVAKLEKSQAYTITGELGQKVGKLTGAICNTPLHPVTGCVVFTEAMTGLWESFKNGFESSQEDFRRVAARRAKEEEERLKAMEEALAKQQEAQAI